MKICLRCGKKFSTKSNLNVHLKRQNPCISKYLDICGMDVISNYNKYYSAYLEKKNKEKVVDEIINYK